MMCSRASLLFGAGKDDLKRKTLNFFRATRNFSNGSLRPPGALRACKYPVPTGMQISKAGGPRFISVAMHYHSVIDVASS